MHAAGRQIDWPWWALCCMRRMWRAELSDVGRPLRVMLLEGERPLAVWFTDWKAAQ